jgi:hypothetical protein
MSTTTTTTTNNTTTTNTTQVTTPPTTPTQGTGTTPTVNVNKQGVCTINTKTVTVQGVKVVVPVQGYTKTLTPVGGYHTCIMGGMVGSNAWYHNMVFMLNPNTVFSMGLLFGTPTTKTKPGSFGLFTLGTNVGVLGVNGNKLHLQQQTTQNRNNVTNTTGTPLYPIVVTNGGYQLNPNYVKHHPTHNTGGLLKMVKLPNTTKTT